MGDWYSLLTPLAVLAVVLLVRFVGCGSFLPESSTPETKPNPDPTITDPVPDYPKTVREEKNLGTTSVLVSYWRLQETDKTNPAKDEKGANPGQYKTPAAALTDLGPERSPAAPGTLDLGKPGNLEFEPSDVCMETNGGYVEVPFSATLNNLPSFTLEAIVVPLWSASISTASPGRYRSVIEFGGKPPKKTGFALYGGPPDFADPTTGQYCWQVGIGNGNAFKRFIGPPVIFNVANYIAATYDGPTKQLVFYLFHAGVDLDKVKQPAIAVPQTDLNNLGSLPLLIGMGRSMSTGSPDIRFPLQGRIQEVAIYNAALNENRVIAHFTAAFKDF